MNLQSINESFKKFVHGTSYTNPLREALGEGAEGEKLELADALFNAIRSLRGKGVSDMKTYEKAFQDVLERIFPEKDWFDVTSVNIFWDLMNTKDPEQTAINILADIYRPEETVETEETVEVTEDTVKRGGKRMNVGKDGSHGVVYIGNAKIVSREELPKVGDKNERGDSTVTLVKRVADEDGHEIYHVYYTENDALDLIEPNEEPDVDTAIWSFAVPIKGRKNPVNETAYGASELDGMINNTEWAYNRLINIVNDKVAKGWKKERIVRAVSMAIYDMKDDFGKLPTTREERLKIARDFVDTALPKDYIVEEKKPIKEQATVDERRNALAKYLGVEPETLKKASYSDVNFETEDGEEYLVLDSDEAREAAIEAVKNDLDDMGIESFTDDFKDWAYRNAIETDWFDDALRESEEFYADDIESEDDREYGNRLIHEMYDEGILEDDDFEKDEDGEIDYTRVKETVDIDSKKEDFVDKLVENMGDAVEWYRSEFGEDELARTVRENNLIDADAVAEEAIDWDGVEHFLASYDGEEIELDDGWYAYRTN